MKCLACNLETKVLESRLIAQRNIIRRRRQCCQCDSRFTTYEKIETPNIIVLKNDGSQEYFNFEKLLAGLLRATKKTKTTAKQTHDLAYKIERHIISMDRSVIKSKEIGMIVVEHLKKTDKAAYLRFICVYKGFKTISRFEKEIASLKNNK